MIVNKKEILELIWENNDGVKFNIGELCRREGKYYFKYNKEETKKAIEIGFNLLSSFPKLNAQYFREELFRIFASKLPNKSRREFNENIEEYDEFLALKELNEDNSKDNFYFKEIILEENKNDNIDNNLENNLYT